MQIDPVDIGAFLISLTIILLGFAVVTIFLIYHYIKNRWSYKKNMSEIKLIHEKELLASQLEVQENIFQHIARELHDNVSLALCLVKIQLTSLELNDPERLQSQISSSVEILTESLVSLNALSKGLNRDQISHYGLLKAIETEVKRIQNLRLFTIDFVVNGEAIFIDNDKELILFRIVQEGLNNIIKHSHATYAKLDVEYQDLQILISISDNGRGLAADYVQKNNSDGSGLRNMRFRTETLGGTMASMPVKTGTYLLFKIPINYGNSETPNQNSPR